MQDRLIVKADSEEKELLDVSTNPMTRASDEVLKSRKIFELKKREPSQTEPKKTQQGFVFQRAELSEKKEEENKQVEGFRADLKIDPSKANTSLFFNNNKKDEVKETDKEVEPVKLETTPEKSKEIKPAEKEETDKQSEDKKEESKPKTSLFNNPKSSLFGNQTNSLFNQTNKPILFSNTKPLFSSTDKKSSLFSQENKTSLFGNTEPAKAGSIFSNVQNNFFKTSGQQEPDEEEEDKEPQFEDIKPEDHADPNIDVLSLKNCRIFKVGDSDPFNLGFISINKMKTMNDLCVLIFRDKMKKILHKSMVIPKVSKSCYMKNKKNAITVSTIAFGKPDNTKKEGEETDKETKNTSKVLFAKIGFISEEDAAEFKEELDKVIGSA